MKARAPIVFAFVLALAFLLLLVTFRSIVIPIKAIVLNLLSVGAAYGVLVGSSRRATARSCWASSPPARSTAWLPMFLFVILFGLSMDYHVFILSRVREAFDRGMSTEDAVAHGIKATAGAVTSAAAVMVAVFAIFATLSAHRLQDDGRRPRDRDPHRRDDRPGGPAARDDEAPGRVELVPAASASSGCRRSATGDPADPRAGARASQGVGRRRGAAAGPGGRALTAGLR